MRDYWLFLGFAGQMFFTMRFIVQWLASERRKKSVTPTAFWYFSLLGGVVLLIYAIHRRDPVFIIGQATGLFIYLRNLDLLRRNRSALSAARQPPLENREHAASAGPVEEPAPLQPRTS